MVQPFVKVLPVYAPKPPPSIALIVPLIVALDATKAPDRSTLNGAAAI